MPPQQDKLDSEDRDRKSLEILRQTSDSQWINDYLDLAKELFEFLELQSGDPRLVISPRGKDRISISINQRWVFTANPSKSSLGFIFGSDFAEISDMLSTSINTKSWRFDPFKTETKDTTPYFLWFQGYSKDLLTSTQELAWKEAALIEAKRGSASSHLRWHAPTLYRAIVDLDYRDLLLSQLFPEDYQKIDLKKVNRDERSDLNIQRQKIESEGYFDAANLEDARKKVTTSIVQRQGQSEFRRKLLTLYGGECAITGCDVEPAIEAAHIIPYQGTSTNHPANGLPLRADIHTLFDLHLISIQPDSYEVIIAPELDGTFYQGLAQKKRFS
ncbi:MAG: HNH endonuclease signature motif containing protein [Cyanobacteria bacterium]|nr:HNH endonuclease signature motif containing protein [Cyanobacteriota bacterium]